MKLKVGKGGGEEPKKNSSTKSKSATSTSLTFDQINKWSDYAEANPNKSFDELFVGFQKQNPNSDISHSVLQDELTKLRANAIRMGTKTGSDLGSYIHTGYSFTKAMVDGKDAGRMNANLVSQYGMKPPTTPFPERLLQKTIPPDAANIAFDEKTQMVTYEDPKTGDVMYAKREALSTPQQRQLNMMKAKTEIPKRQNLLQVQSVPIAVIK
jgi:hypothetical protein